MSKKSLHIPLSIPCLGPEEAEAVARCIESGWVSNVSPQVREFEQQFASKLGAENAVATTSGTAALHLAMIALDIGPGDEVIVPALTFIATVNPVRYVGATPVFVDAEGDTLGMDPEAVEAAITPKTKAIVVTHLYGIPARIQELQAIAQRHGLFLIEDAAEALGATIQTTTGEEQHVGTFGTVGCFSFNGNKVITCGGGGMLVTNSPTIANKVHHLSIQAREMNTVEVSHDDIGHNLRMNGIQATMGIAQLAKLDRFVERKREIAHRYAEFFNGIKEMHSFYTPRSLPRSHPSYWLSVGLLDDPRIRNMVIEYARERGIEMRPFFKPLPFQKPYKPWLTSTYPKAVDLWSRGLCLPSSCTMTDEELDIVLEVLSQCFKDLDGKTEGSLEYPHLALLG